MQTVLGTRLRLLVLVPVLAALGACETSSRLGSMMPGGGAAPPSRMASRGAPAPLTPAPVGEVYTSDLGGGGVSSSSLPPPGSAPLPSAGAAPARAGGLSAPGNLPPGGNPASPIDPPPGAPTTTGGTTYYPGGSSPNTAAPGANPAAPTPPRVASAPASSGGSPSRTSVIGNWSVSEAAGGSCRITLSSAPKLDLYGAGTTGCQSKELQRVNAWELAGSEVLLYEPGGGVVARLRQSGSGYAGATAKTGAPVSLSK